MRQDFKSRLRTWQNDLPAGEAKRVLLSDSPRHDGEFMVTLERTFNKSFGEKIARITVKKNYLTTAQANSLLDPHEDIDQLDFVIGSVDKEFNDRYQKLINDAFADNTIRLALTN